MLDEERERFAKNVAQNTLTDTDSSLERENISPFRRRILKEERKKAAPKEPRSMAHSYLPNTVFIEEDTTLIAKEEAKNYLQR